MTGEIHHMLAGTAAGLDHVAGLVREIALQYRPDRLMVAVERGRVEAPVGLDPPAILAKFHDIFSHIGFAPGPLRSRLNSFKRQLLQCQNRISDMTPDQHGSKRP